MSTDFEAKEFDVGVTSVRIVRVGNVVQLFFSNKIVSKFFFDEIATRFKRDEAAFKDDHKT